MKIRFKIPVHPTETKLGRWKISVPIFSSLLYYYYFGEGCYWSWRDVAITANLRSKIAADFPPYILEIRGIEALTQRFLAGDAEIGSGDKGRRVVVQEIELGARGDANDTNVVDAEFATLSKPVLVLLPTYLPTCICCRYKNQEALQGEQKRGAP